MVRFLYTDLYIYTTDFMTQFNYKSVSESLAAAAPVSYYSIFIVLFVADILIFRFCFAKR